MAAAFSPPPPQFCSTPSSASAYSAAPQSLQFNPLKLRRSRTFSVRASAEDSVVTLLDYGAGNVRSVRNAIRFLGYDIKDVQGPEDILNARRLIFPGVGAFAPAMDVLEEKGLAEALCNYIEQDRPFLGICLGLQLLFESSEENGPVKGLGLIPGVVGRFDSSNGLRVPHIGWNAIKVTADSQILDEIESRHVYFVHSYRATPSDDNKEWISSTCNYGSDFIASIRRGNVHAVQFHPEKSGEVGLSVLRRFLYPKSETTKVPIKVKASKLAKRVIACLDVRANDKGDLVVTKGDQYDVREQTNENEVRNLGKPVELAGQYYTDGADEVSFLNITGYRDFPLGDLPMLQVLRYASENVFVPLTVGGGIRDFTDGNGRYYSSLEVASEYFRSGADKVSIGSDAVYAAEEYLKTKVKTGKTSIEQISRVYGNQAVVISIDPRRVYLKDPNDVEFKSVTVSKPGPNGEQYAWYQCTVNGRLDLDSIPKLPTMAAALSLCYSLTPKLPHNQTQPALSLSRPNISFLSHSLSSLTLTARKHPALSFTVKLTDTEDAVSVIEPETEISVPETEPAVETAEPKREEVFAVVMVGGRQYIVFPGRFIYTQRLKGANVNDKVTLNKVLLVGTKTSAYIGKPIVPNATVQAVVEEQALDKKVIVYKYKKKKNYRRNIGHRQPITRIRITSITGYQDSPVTTLEE